MKTDTTETVSINDRLHAMGYTLESSDPSAVIEGDNRFPVLRYSVTLSRHGREILTTSYTMGVGPITPTHWKKAERDSRSPFSPLGTVAGVLRTLANKPQATLVDREQWRDAAERVARAYDIAPKLDDVVMCLVTDGSAYFDAESFEEWAADYGYDPDSRKAEVIWRACDDTGRKLARAIPADELETLREMASEW